MKIDSLHVFFQLIKRDLLAFRREFGGKFLDTFLLFFTNIVVFSYFMPETGLQSSYGPFLLIGAISSFGLFEVIGKTSTLISDIEGDRVISHTLTLPIRSEFVFSYFAVSWAITSAILCALLFPIGKILLYTRFDISAITYVRFIPMFVTINIFFGCFSLWLASMIRGMGGIGGIYMRVIVPLFMFGAYFYSWKMSYELSPLIAYISLINPMVYVMEGMRAAALGQEGYIPFWISFIALWGFIIALFLHAINRLKKRLDCI